MKRSDHHLAAASPRPWGHRPHRVGRPPPSDDTPLAEHQLRPNDGGRRRGFGRQPRRLTEVQTDGGTSRRQIEREREFEPFPHQQLLPIGLETIELVPLPPVGFARTGKLGHCRIAVDPATCIGPASPTIGRRRSSRLNPCLQPGEAALPTKLPSSSPSASPGLADPGDALGPDSPAYLPHSASD